MCICQNKNGEHTAKCVYAMSLPKPVPSALEVNAGEKPNAGVCEECNWKGPLTDCSWEYEQDGWEQPRYRVDLCPECGGALYDYYYSEEI